MKPPIFHPYSTNTGQVLLTDLIAYPLGSVLFEFTSAGGGVPVAPVQITTEDIGGGLLLQVHSSVHILVGMDTLPVVTSGGVLQSGTMLLWADFDHILQWPSQYFTPIPVGADADASVYVNILRPQNSTGDPYKVENR